MKSKNILIVGVLTIVILSVPLIAMQFTDEVKWSVTDFLLMGTLIFGAGITFQWFSSRGSSLLYRIAVGISVLAVFLLTWANLAVGVIGSEQNPANLLYFLMILIGIIGALIVRFKAKGMALVACIMAGVQILIPLIALAVWAGNFDPGIEQVLAINSFFALMFVASAVLFKRASMINSQTT